MILGIAGVTDLLWMAVGIPILVIAIATVIVIAKDVYVLVVRR